MIHALWLHDATRAHWRSRRVRIWALVLILAAGILAFVPLFNRLGFGFAFVMAILASAASLDLGAAFVRCCRAACASAAEPGDVARTTTAVRPHQLMLGLWNRAALVNLALLGLPLLLICANGLRVRNCDWLFGLHTFTLMTLGSALIATTLGMLIGLACGPRRRWLGNVLPILVLLGSVAHSVWRFYAAPPVFSYDPFAGYFPGNLYDEHIALHAAFYWARLEQVCMAVAACALATVLLDAPGLCLGLRRSPVGLRWRAGVLAVALSAAAGVLHASGGVLGFHVDADDIAAELGGRYDTEHFIIYFPAGGEIERDIHHIAADHEFRYAQVVRTLGAAPSQRITSFYFASTEDKFRMMGARNVYMAKPWRNEIYVHHQDFPHQILRHEIAHAVAAMFGSPVFRVSAAPRLGLPLAFNVGLIEGTAVAADWPDHFTGELTPHQSVKAMRELDMAPPLDAVLSTEFLAFSSARSYTVAGSFVRFLLDSYGSQPFRTLYQTGGDFQAAYGRPAAELFREWDALIDATELPPRTAETVRERFRRPGIFFRPCPDAIARARSEAARRWARGERDHAIELLRRVCDQAPDEPSYKLDLAGLLTGHGQSQAAAEIYQGLAQDADNISSSLRAEALLELAGISARAGDWTRAVAFLDQAAALPVDGDRLRNVMAQRFVATYPGPAGPALRDYFWGEVPVLGLDPLVLMGRAALAIAAEPDLGLAYYLVGRNLRGLGAPADATRALARALDLGLPHPLLTREAARHLAENAYLAGQWDLVERAAHILLLPEQPAVVRLYGADWLERLHWKRTGELLAPPPSAP